MYIYMPSYIKYTDYLNINITLYTYNPLKGVVGIDCKKIAQTVVDVDLPDLIAHLQVEGG